MAFDGLFINRILKELNQALLYGRVERIYQTSAQTFRMVFHTRTGRQALVLSADSALYGAYLSSADDRMHIESQFSKALRKHLEGALLISAQQYLSDRVILLTFKQRDLIEGDVLKTVVFEAMGRHSNLILIENDIVVDCLKHMFHPDGRKLVPGSHFEYFKSDKKSFFDIDYQMIRTPDDLVRTYLGISPLLASYLHLHPLQVDAIMTNPTRNESDGKFYVFDLFDDSGEKSYFSSLSALMASRGHQKTESGLGEKRFIAIKLKSLRNRLSAIEEDIRKTQDELLSREHADLVYMSGEDLTSKRSDIVVRDVRVMLDPTKTLNENAQALYHTYQKAKRGLDYLDRRLEQTNDDIRTFESFETYADIADTRSLEELSLELIDHGFKSKIQRQKQLKNQIPGYITIETPKAIYAIGKNASQNAYLTHTYAHKSDFWFHVRSAPGSHVIVRTMTLDEEVIRTAAMLAAHFSKMRYSQSIPVDYTAIRFIRKIPGHLGSEVTYSHHKTIFIDVIESVIQAVFSQEKKRG